MSANGGKRGLKRKVCVLLIGLAIIGGLIWYVRNYVSLDDLVEREKRIREGIAQSPWRSFGIGLMIYAVVSLVPGTSGKSIVFAWLFGFWLGVLMIILGLTAAGLAMFYLSRYVFRDWIENRYGKLLGSLNRHLQKEGAFYLLTLRMAHFPFSVLNLVSGASRLRPWTFCWATALGLLPGTAVFAYVGSRLPSLEKLAEQGVGSLIDPWIFVALVVSAGFPFVFRWCARKLGVLKENIHLADPEDEP